MRENRRIKDSGLSTQCGQIEAEGLKRDTEK